MLLFYGLLVAAHQIDLVTAESVSVVVGVVLLLTLFIAIEGKARDPLLPMALFRLPDYSRPAVLSLLAAMGIFGVIGFLPLYVQGALGGSATLAGLTLLPLSVGLDRREHDRRPGRAPLGVPQRLRHRHGPDGRGLHPVHGPG